MSTEKPTQTFKRVLSRRDLVLYGLVILTPTAPYPLYGIIQQASHGYAALSYGIAMIGMLFTGASYARMSAAYPSAGSTYTYTRLALHEHVGFLAGWAMILDYFLIPLLSVIYAAITAHRILPAVPYLVWAVVFNIAITAVNIFGIKVTASASRLMMWIMSICALLFATLAIHFVLQTHGISGLFSLEAFLPRKAFDLRALILGAGIATVSYIGFDAISTLAEDTLHPTRDIGFATVLVCILETIICVVTVYLATLVLSDYTHFRDPETTILDIGTLIGGPWMLGLLVFVLLVAGLASALTGQAGASRLLFGMGRDGVISPRIFSYLSPRFSTPTRSICLMGGLSLAGALLLRFQLAVELLNFGAFAGFVLVNVSVIRHYYFRLHERRGFAFFRNFAFPACGALVCAYVWMNLSAKAKLAGFTWLGIGVCYIALRFRIGRRYLRTFSNS